MVLVGSTVSPQNPRTPEHPNSRTLELPNTQTPEHPNSWTPEHLNTRTPELPNSRTPEHGEASKILGRLFFFYEPYRNKIIFFIIFHYAKAREPNWSSTLPFPYTKIHQKSHAHTANCCSARYIAYYSSSGGTKLIARVPKLIIKVYSWTMGKLPHF